MKVFAGQGGEVEAPVLDAGEAVHGTFLTVVAWAEPGKEEWDAAADRLAGDHVGFWLRKMTGC